MAPPFTLRATGRLHGVIQDVVRSSSMRDVPFFDRGAITDLADHAYDRNARPGAADPLLIMAASLCALQERYKL